MVSQWGGKKELVDSKKRVGSQSASGSTLMLDQEGNKKKDTKLQIRDPKAQVLRATMLETRDREGKRNNASSWAGPEV